MVVFACPSSLFHFFMFVSIDFSANSILKRDFGLYSKTADGSSYLYKYHIFREARHCAATSITTITAMTLATADWAQRRRTKARGGSNYRLDNVGMTWVFFHANRSYS